jgi:hypothetical protein
MRSGIENIVVIKTARSLRGLGLELYELASYTFSSLEEEEPDVIRSCYLQTVPPLDLLNTYSS